MNTCELLRDGLVALGCNSGADTVERFERYLDQLSRWNRVHNLTAVRSREAMVVRHVLDSLTALPLLYGVRVIDVGSGAGLPGIPLAVLDAGRDFVLLDSSAKRAHFLVHVTGVLGLERVQVVHARAEDYRPAAGFDTVICRAFADLRRFITAAGHLCAPGGRLLAMKGVFPAQEIKALPAPWELGETRRVSVPGLDAERHVLALTRAN